MKKLSLLNKLFIFALPVAFSAVIIAIIIYQKSSINNFESNRALLMLDYASAAELEMVKMSEALRGYLINPDNLSEWERKKAADAAYADNAEKLAKLLGDAPEIAAINKEMADFDAGTLDKIENQTGDLIKRKNPKAVEFYQKTYDPARLHQAENFKKLKELVHKKSDAILLASHASRLKQSILIAAMLVISVFAGLGFMLWISTTTIKKLGIVTQDLGEYSNSLNQSSSQISNMSSTLADATNSQVAAVQESVAAISEMSSMIQKTVISVESALKCSENAKEKTSNGTLTMEQLSKQMKDIQDANVRMQGIAKMIEDIGAKTNVINSIVFKTQLLSFNASIEAARAGEFGKGFAVVAEEVGSLADMSGKASKEIETLLENSRKNVKEILELITKKVDDSKRVGGDAQKAFEDIASNVDSLCLEMKLIHEASQQQNIGIKELNTSMRQMETSANTSAKASSESQCSASALADYGMRLDALSKELIKLVTGSERANFTPATTAIKSNVHDVNETVNIRSVA